MIKIEKVLIEVLVFEVEDNVCAKCCKTLQVLDRMMDAFPEFKDKVEIIQKDVESKDIIEKFGELEGPVLIVNDEIFSEGHVPIVKKLAREILNRIDF